MDARAFGNFLSGRLKEALAPLENNILNLVAEDLNRNGALLYRSAGARDILLDLIKKIEPLLQEFHNSRGSISSNEVLINE
jgi:hypothetical protein